MAPGVMLVGDAAGHNDPTIGQGLSIALRDVRIVSELMLSSPRWDMDAFTAYAEERRAYMGRLRTSARVFGQVRLAFGEAGRELRRRVFRRVAEEPMRGGVLLAAIVGPETFPSAAFEPTAIQQLLAE